MTGVIWYWNPSLETSVEILNVKWETSIRSYWPSRDKIIFIYNLQENKYGNQRWIMAKFEIGSISL